MNDEWRFNPSVDCGRDFPENECSTWINVDSPKIGSMHIHHDAVPRDERIRRARLISAAPELLAALRDAHIALIEYRAYGESMREIGRGFDASGHDGATITTVLARIGAAIRKATGEEG